MQILILESYVRVCVGYSSPNPDIEMQYVVRTFEMLSNILQWIIVIANYNKKSINE